MTMKVAWMTVVIYEVDQHRPRGSRQHLFPRAPENQPKFEQQLRGASFGFVRLTALKTGGG